MHPEIDKLDVGAMPLSGYSLGNSRSEKLDVSIEVWGEKEESSGDLGLSNHNEDKLLHPDLKSKAECKQHANTMELWFEWGENNEEHLSFDDSDRFEEDSLCSWGSEPESLCGNWRGWKRSSQNGVQFDSDLGEGTVETLIEICARTVAEHFPFETVECKFPQIPEQLQQRIAFWSFPLFEEDIRLYSCLANGSPDKFLEGEQLLKVQAVKDILQIGFHLSATVHQPHSICQSKGIFNVAVTFDRGHITSCNCTCNQTATWCSHVIALCLFRIHFPKMVCLRAPVSEYVSRLRRDQLQKFAQYLITELPQQLLPTAQRLLDELLSSQESTINSLPGAPDPTAGPSATDHSKWYLDESSLHENIKKMLVRFCGPSPLVFSDVNALFLANTAPPTAAEWSNFLRPLQGREPEGMWNLLSIVRELFHRSDSNAVNLLVILTEECLANDQVLIWWYDSRSQASGKAPFHSYGNNYRGNTNTASTEATKHACAGFCDELVALWRLAALNPKLSDDEREELKIQLQEWHKKAVDKGQTGRGASLAIPPAARSCFPGFLSAIEVCSLNWKNVDLGLVPKERNHEPELSLALKNDTGIAKSCKSTETGLNENVLSSVESPVTTEENVSSSSLDDHNPIVEVREDLQVLCARMEALHVHGYSSLAGKLAVKLAEDILREGRNICHFDARSKKLGASVTSFTDTILLKAGFLCNVLAEDLHCHHLAFRVGMLGLEISRHPAKSKALEVKYLHQESELVSLLKKLPLGPAELAIVKEKAGLLHHGELRRGEAVLPIMLASFMFDVLKSSDTDAKAKRQAVKKVFETTKEDEELGFKAALYAIGMKGNTMENHYPMLCEGTRQQRGDLALTLLVYCRDDPLRIRQIMDILLDKNRYDLPNAARTAQEKKRVERSDSQDSKAEGKESKAVETNADKSKVTIELPNRENSHQSSSTSDSGTDSSCKDSSGIDRCKLRGGNESSHQQRLTASFASLSSGCSSGVDTDCVPVPHHELAAYEVDLQRTKENAVAHDESILHSDEPLSKALRDCESTQYDPFINSSQHLEPAGDTSSFPRPVTVPQRKEDVIDLNHLRKHASLVKESDAIPPRQNTQENSEPNLCALSTNVPCPGEGNSHSLLFQSVHQDFHRHSNDTEAVNSCSSDKPKTNQRVILASHGLSSEGDVSDNEADFDECHTRVQQELLDEIQLSRNLVKESEMREVGASPSKGAIDSEVSETSNVLFQGGSIASSSVTEGECFSGGDAAVTAPPEAAEEQSSGSGSRGSVSAGIEDTNRSRRRRGRRRRRGGKSVLYQATEAEAHFMFELAKAVLSKAGGGNGTSVFTQTASSDAQAGVHRVLQLCAFEIGLFALGLHNRTSANWLSRTYSSHVSWISGQAMEIGHQAITLLLKSWEGNLTPSEVASIADRASRSNDQGMVHAAAELGLSCLHMATTLNPGEIQRALSQCREEDVELLEQGCQAVESAARGGGVYPEVLFEVAKHWYHLHEKNQTNNSSASRSGKSESRSRGSLSRSSQSLATSGHSSPVSPFVTQVTQFTMPLCYPSIPPPLYTTPEQYVQQQMHHKVHQMMGCYPAYLPGVSSGYRSYSHTRSLTGPHHSLSGGYLGPNPPPYQATNFNSSLSQYLNRVSATQQGTHVSYHLNSAYRVGMLALEFLSRRTSDDRPNVKFSRNPNCSDDIRWLCSLCARLGNSHLQRFCVAALNAVTSPFILHDLALEAARHMARSTPAQLTANLRSPTISPLVQKSLTMYAQCIHYNLMKISQSEYDEFVELLRHARGAFCMAPGGMTQFNELLQSIRRGQPKKKELWQMIMTGLAKA